MLRHRLDITDAVLDFPILHDLKAVPVANLIRWQMIANQAMLSPDVGPLQTDLVGACRAVPIETGARGGEPRAAPADQRPAADRAKKASPQQH
jgi:hypothetical protein